jgi:GT2 family glycosyltransferase
VTAPGDRVRLSVVIPCRNGEASLGTQLERLAAQESSEPWEVIVADNGSTDGTAALVAELQRRMPNLRLVDASARVGVNHARNAGARAARGSLLAFCDDDDEAQPGWVAAMTDALLRHEFVAGRLDMDLLNEPWMVAIRGRPQTEGVETVDGRPPYAVGCNLGIRRDVHERIGGFDEDFAGFAEDIDYSWRAHRAGATLHFEPNAVIAYRLKQTLGAMYRQARSYALGYVSLYARHRGGQLPRQRHALLYGVLSWAGILRHVPRSASKQALARFLWQLGWKVGMVEGSVKNRVLLLSVRGLPTPSTTPHDGAA